MSLLSSSSESLLEPGDEHFKKFGKKGTALMKQSGQAPGKRVTVSEIRESLLSSGLPIGTIKAEGAFKLHDNLWISDRI